MTGYLLLEDGTRVHGRILGAKKSSMGEIVFHTGMTGYQEIVTDPSYYGQIVVLTYPMIGNYGICESRNQSDGVKAKALIVKDLYQDKHEDQISFLSYLEEEGITVLEGVDTRLLTQIVREKGHLRGQIVVDEPVDFKEESGLQAVYQVSCQEAYEMGRGKIRLAVLDFGIKRGILRALKDQGFHLKVFPATSNFEQIQAYKPHGVFLSNGPGDPSQLHEIIEQVKKITDQYPTFGICLGHQLIAHAYGCQTSKLKYGHRGGNHPVKNLDMDRVYITSQNHGYVVEGESINSTILDITHVHVNDQSVEGLRHKDKPVFSVQYHPEASPGPDDASYLFEMFHKMICQNMEVANV